MSKLHLTFTVFIILLSGTCVSAQTTVHVDVLIRNGIIYDGTGRPPFKGDVAVSGDRVSAIGNLKNYKGGQEIDARGMAVAPGFINVLSWAINSLLADGRGQSDTRQGITLEVFGEGFSQGPLNPQMKSALLKDFPSNKFDTSWKTLGQFMQMMENKVTPNVASFVGAATVREYVLGNDDRAPTAEELSQMKGLVKQAMEEGALGLGSSLIYPPGFFAKTNELIELSKVVAQYKGMYISHIRSEGSQLLESIDELIRISKEAKIPAEIWHFKMAGQSNWNKFAAAVKKIEQARAAGQHITTDMYLYTAAATGLSATMPPWAQEGGFNKFLERLNDSITMEKIKSEMLVQTDKWENLFLSNGGPSGILFSQFKKDSLRKYTGKTLEEVSVIRGQTPEQTAIDLIREDSTRIEAVYFMMNEENVKKELRLPYMSFCSDAESVAPEGDFLNFNPHPRAYGNFARLLGKYVRDEKVISMEKAIHGLTGLPAENMHLAKRGLLKKGYYADVVIFDPSKIQDHATFKEPHQYSTGMLHVFVNGVQVLKDGEHTGATPGRFVKGPGYKIN